MRKPKTALSVVAVAATATLSLGGVALAATGLPGAADDNATTNVPASVELTIPAGEAANDHADERGHSSEPTGDEVATDDAAATETDGEDAAPAATPQPRPTDTHGFLVSSLATTTEATGADKGAEISAVASEGRARAHAPATDDAEATDEATDEADDAAEQTAPARSETGEAARAEHAGADAR